MLAWCPEHDQHTTNGNRNYLEGKVKRLWSHEVHDLLCKQGHGGRGCQPSRDSFPSGASGDSHSLVVIEPVTDSE